MLFVCLTFLLSLLRGVLYFRISLKWCCIFFLFLNCILSLFLTVSFRKSFVICQSSLFLCSFVPVPLVVVVFHRNSDRCSADVDFSWWFLTCPNRKKKRNRSIWHIIYESHISNHSLHEHLITISFRSSFQRQELKTWRRAIVGPTAATTTTTRKRMMRRITSVLHLNSSRKENRHTYARHGLSSLGQNHSFKWHHLSCLFCL